MNDSGLPDYVDDLFNYLVRSTLPQRIGQVLFFITGLILPVLLLMVLPNLEGERALESPVPLIVTGVVFGACLFWYLSFLEVRRHRFRKEKPASYARWFGWKQKRLGSGNVFAQMDLLQMQFRYVFFGKEPSSAETLALTMRFVRRST